MNNWATSLRCHFVLTPMAADISTDSPAANLAELKNLFPCGKTAI
jgi:hypothetical protein